MIRFYTHEVDFKLLDQKKLKLWISTRIADAGYQLEALNYVFCSDEHLLQMNKEHLQHDYYTDIITFDYSERLKVFNGELYISIDRILENASENHVSFADELHRVMIHGVLHLLGFKDKTAAEQTKMREQEENALAKRTFHVKHYSKK